MRFLVVAAFLAGAVLLLYPEIADWSHRGRSTSAITQYGAAVDGLDARARSTALAAARSYNARLVGSSPSEPGVPSEGADDYWKQLRVEGSALMARVRIPSIGVDLPVFHGTAEATLLEGVGHLEGSALPVGGTGSHAVVTAHRGLVNAKLFTDLDRVGVGDTITIDVLDEVLTYRVIESRVVEPDATETLMPVPDRDLVTLITCTPLGVNSQRILVTAERVETPQEVAAAIGSFSGGAGFPWWMPVLLAAFAAATAYLCLSARGRGRIEGVPA